MQKPEKRSMFQQQSQFLRLSERFQALHCPYFVFLLASSTSFLQKTLQCFEIPSIDKKSIKSYFTNSVNLFTLKFRYLLIIIYKQGMGKSEKVGEKPESKSNKTHKTLREKLRKKREQLKRHKKEKSEHKKQYNAAEEKLKFFEKGEERNDNNKEVRLKKILKYIEKFINIYEDDLDQFYDMFKTFDEGGFIDVSGLENKALQKCLKKLFKYLPIKKEKGEYRKAEGAATCLEKFIRNKVSESIENYLQNGSRGELSNEESSNDDNEEKETKKAKGHKAPVKTEEMEEEPQVLRLYKETIPETATMGPYIPPEVREQMAQLFEQQLLQRQKEKEETDKAEEDEFSRIFSSGKTRKQIKEGNVPKADSAVPEHLMAQGSALIGQKVEIDDNEIEEYNRIHRPKKLIELHKEMRQGIVQEDPKKRKPFDRQRDVLGSGKMSLMNNSTFFDFKSRMSKPKQTNQFL